jgi:hypothetical protein
MALEKNEAYWTYDSEAGAYYFAPDPDIASDGTLAGVELVMGDLPPSPKGALKL